MSKKAKKKNVKESIAEIIYSGLFLLLFVLLTLSTYFKWDEMYQNIIMSSILLFSFVAAIYPLVKKNKTDWSERIIVIVSFTLLIVAVIVFASVSTGIYREPVIQISASVTGGLLALYGIGLTIKFNRLEKEKDDIEKAKPNVFPISDEVWEQLPNGSKLERSIIIHPSLTKLSKAKRTDACYSIAPIYLENSDLSMCTFKGIGINDEGFIVFGFDNVMLKGSVNCFYIDYSFVFSKEIESVQLVLGDMYKNTYSCYVSFGIDKSRNRKNKPIYIYGIKKIALMDANKYETYFSKDE